MSTVYDTTNSNMQILPAEYQPQAGFAPQGGFTPQPPVGYQAQHSTAMSVLNLDSLPTEYRSQQPSKVMQEAVEGIEQITRYSLKPRTGTLVKQVGDVPLEAPQFFYDAIIAGVSNLQRIYYADDFNPALANKNKKPTCFSPDGKFPDPNVPDANWPRWFNSQTQQQERVVSCEQCPFSKKRPGEQASACRYKKEAAIIFPDDETHTVFSFNISASSLFGDEDGPMMPFQEYINALTNHNARVERLVTRIVSSQKVTYPQTRFIPYATVNPADFAKIDEIVASKEVENIIKRTPSYDTSSTTEAAPASRSPIIGAILSKLDNNNKEQFTKWVDQQPISAATDENIIKILKQYFPAVFEQASKESTAQQSAAQFNPVPQPQPVYAQAGQQQQQQQQPVPQFTPQMGQTQGVQQHPQFTPQAGQQQSNPQFQQPVQQPVRHQYTPQTGQQPNVGQQPNFVPQPPSLTTVTAAPASASPSPAQSAMNAGAAPSNVINQGQTDAAYDKMFANTDFSQLQNFDK